MAAPARRCLVVGYDAGEPSERALTWAVARAGRGGHVVVVHAARRQRDLLHVGPGPGRRDRFDHARATVELPFLERRDVYEIGDCDYELRDESPVDALLAVAEELGAEAIVVGTRGRDRLRSVTGSVCAELLRRSDRPVVVVP